MGEIRQEVVVVTTTGSAGAASGNADSGVIHGWIEDIYLDFHASTPATADTTISFKDRGGNILLVTNSATDVLVAPRVKPVDNANTAITNAHARFVCNQKVNVAVAQGDALTGAVTAYIRYEAV